MRQGVRVGVIIPALNEQEAIGKVINDTPNWVDTIIVVDNGSTDKTADSAKSQGAIVCYEPVKGYGKACLTGISHLQDHDIIVFLDGDYSDYPEDMDRLVDPIAAGDYDFVIGSRIKGIHQTGALTVQQRFGNWLACSLMWLFWRTQYTDLGPFRAISATALRKLDMSDTGYGWTIEMQIKAKFYNLKTKEVAVNYRERIGKSKISGTLRGSVLAGFKILHILSQYILRYGFTLRPARK